mmetsp:Transcript_9077/g.35506  ORF Transcript_9077/g.35506 Transcript_9077/m.35506 type:complete len:233 (-) Transcript_9077:2098-2796(-)
MRARGFSLYRISRAACRCCTRGKSRRQRGGAHSVSISHLVRRHSCTGPQQGPAGPLAHRQGRGAFRQAATRWVLAVHPASLDSRGALGKEVYAGASNAAAAASPRAASKQSLPIDGPAGLHAAQAASVARRLAELDGVGASSGAAARGSRWLARPAKASEVPLPAQGGDHHRPSDGHGDEEQSELCHGDDEGCGRSGVVRVRQVQRGVVHFEAANEGHCKEQPGGVQVVRCR